MITCSSSETIEMPYANVIIRYWDQLTILNKCPDDASVLRCVQESLASGCGV
jgi:hypothetical protein